MTSQEKMQYIHYMMMKDELDNVAFSGVELKLDGLDSSAHRIATVCVFNEDTDYMRDYRRDDHGKISELNFGKINSRKR